MKVSFNENGSRSLRHPREIEAFKALDYREGEPLLTKARTPFRPKRAPVAGITLTEWREFTEDRFGDLAWAAWNLQEAFCWQPERVNLAAPYAFRRQAEKMGEPHAMCCLWIAAVVEVGNLEAHRDLGPDERAALHIPQMPSEEWLREHIDAPH